MKRLITILFLSLSVCFAKAQTFTFTNCSQTGYSGPSQSQADSEYSGTSLDGDVTVSSGIQYWTAPATGTYSIKVRGGEGGQSNSYGGSGSGGDGAMMSGDFTLTAGTVLKILVGQEGYDDYYDGGGGGGTFVTLTDNTPLIIAGGGGGASNSDCSNTYQHGWINENGQQNCNNTQGGTNGSGGNNCTTAGGGGGLLTNGSGTWLGYSFVNGGNGNSASADGGFGCGGSGGGSSGAGGGGGYSGGAGSCWSNYAGGGGSYNSGVNQVNQTGENTGHGYVVISAPPCAYSTTNVLLPVGTTSYSWNGTTYSVGGIYTDTLTSSAGCDSLATLNLTIPTGNGVLANCNDIYTFLPTTVDSLTNYNLVFINTVNATQTLTLSGLSSPFALSSQITLPANGTDSLVLSFNPSSVGNYIDTLDWSGSTFGYGSIIFNGEGVQVSIGVGLDTLTLDTVALGSSVSDGIWLYNSGTGTMTVSDITSDDSTVSVYPNSFSVAEGDSSFVTVTYTPLISGNMNSTISILSNDPTTPSYEVTILANAVSNITGSVCGTFLAINSPYSLIGDITVPDSCTLILEPGVFLNANGYNMTVNGEIRAIGTNLDSIYFTNFNTIELNNQNTSDTINFISISNTNTLYLDNANSFSFNNSSLNCDINPDNFTYGELFDFESGSLPVGWYRGGPVDSTSEAHPAIVVDNISYTGSKSVYFKGQYPYSSADYFLYTAPIECSSELVDVSVWYKREKLDYYNYVYFHYRINNGNWIQFFSQGTSGGTYQNAGSWQQITTQASVNIGDEIEFRFFADIYGSTGNYDENKWYIDRLEVGNFNIQSQTGDVSFNNTDLAMGFLALNSNANFDNCNLNSSNGNSLGYNASIKNSAITSLNGNGIIMCSPNTTLDVFNSTISNCALNGITSISDFTNLSLQYSFIKDNNVVGIKTIGSTSHVNLSSSMVTGNGSYGIQSSGQVNSNYSNVTFNGDDGIFLTGNNFSNIKNSIIWGNDVVNYNQINTSSGVTSITYSTVQGSGAYGTSGGQYYFGDGSIDDDPVFADAQQHMSTFSNCVDAATPWEQDANMPYGLGAVRADLGIFGGPDNWFWGGTPVPDGYPVLTSVQDIPQDQGGMAGILFDASVWDDASLINNVTHYAIWRHFDVNGLSIDSVYQGNWELMGSMPAQSFNAYAYTAPVLGDSSIANGMFSNCYVVVAHTADSATFWYSNVLCGYSVDNLAPASPIASAIANTNGTEVTIFWEEPTIVDYSYSSVFSNNGFTSLGVIDTLTYDFTTLAGNTYTYGVVHYDVNGNGSDTAWVTITIDDNEDLIPLTAGWNLISSNQTPNQNNMSAIFSTLMPGNLVYVTGFNQGSLLYNPNGLPFLNTLNQFTDGYGYWVKVLADDTLSITGSVINSNYKIDLMPGWNLSGYMNPASQDPSVYFDTLITNNNLIYCTGFNQGTQLFNPNGLPFLNSLNSLGRPFGYWIKVNAAANSGTYRLANNEGATFSPDFMFINGTSNLKNHAGEYIEVLNSNNVLMAKLEILQDGFIMTTPVYGDDISTEFLEGLQNGENITFRFNGEEISSDFNFVGNMELKQIDLVFSNDGQWSIYPNPLTTSTTINYQLNTTAYVSIKIFDVAGRVIEELVNASQEASYYTKIWDATYFEKGVYIIEMYIDGARVTSERVVVQ